MITLQFSTTHGFVSWFVRKFTWSDFSHVDAVMDDGKLFGAQWDGVKAREWNYQKFSKTARFTIKVTPEQEAKFWEFLALQKGKKYDKSAIFGFLVHRDWQEDDSWFCSELIAAALAYAGVLILTAAASRITPRDLVIILGTLIVPINEVAKALFKAIRASA